MGWRELCYYHRIGLDRDVIGWFANIIRDIWCLLLQSNYINIAVFVTYTQLTPFLVVEDEFFALQAFRVAFCLNPLCVKIVLPALMVDIK